MGWFARLFKAVPQEEMEGIHLNMEEPHWSLNSPTSFVELFQALEDWLPEGSILYFEGGYPDEEILDFMIRWEIPEQSHVAFGTVWPRPEVHHVPASRETLVELAALMERHAGPELADHFHVYQDGLVLLQWHDALGDPILLSGDLSEGMVKELARRINVDYRKEEGYVFKEKPGSCRL